VPGIRARSWNSPPFDQYALSADADGHAHLAVVGRRGAATVETLEVLHLAWREAQWSAPETVFENPRLYPEYPRLAIGPRGLHLVWFTRTDLWDSTAPKSVWYSERTRVADDP
jgi:hypothetical protein